MKSPHEKPLVIIGAGIAGVAAALELSRKYPTQKITILERATMFSGSTGRNPARMGHGFHYMDLETSIQYLRASIEVQRSYSDFLIGFGEATGRGRYYIHKQSKHPAAEILKLYRAIQAEYQKMCHEDPLNQVFGTPDDFIRVLEEEEYENHVKADLVELAIETAEHLFNFPKFAAHIREVIEANPNIHLVENAEVTHIDHWKDTDSRFSVEMKSTVSGDALEPLLSDYIVNSSWENIEFLNSKISIPYQEGSRTNRLKCLLEVELPQQLRGVNSSFFCMGPFCMFSNMGDGRGMLTLADVTNFAATSALAIDDKMEDYLTGKISAEEMTQISLKILGGVASYIPGMEQSRIIKLHFGIVQTDGDLKLQDIHSVSSGLHKRREIGVREEIQGLTSNPARKLFYFVYNGVEVVKILDMQYEREIKIQGLLAEFIKTSSAEDIKKLRIYLDSWSVGIDNIAAHSNDQLLAQFKEALKLYSPLRHLESSVMTRTSSAFATDEQITTVIKSPLTATSTGASPHISIVHDTDAEIESLLLTTSGAVSGLKSRMLERRACTAPPWANDNKSGTILDSMRSQRRPISAGSIFSPSLVDPEKSVQSPSPSAAK